MRQLAICVWQIKFVDFQFYTSYAENTPAQPHLLPQY